MRPCAQGPSEGGATYDNSASRAGITKAATKEPNISTAVAVTKLSEPVAMTKANAIGMSAPIICSRAM